MGVYYWPPHETATSSTTSMFSAAAPTKRLRFEDVYVERPQEEHFNTGPPDEQKNSKVIHPLIQNYIHDAESLWWILCWFLLTTAPSSENLVSDQQIQKERKDMWYKFFPAQNVRISRRSPATNPFLNATLAQHDALPEAYKPMYDHVYGSLRKKLTESYQSAESLLPGDFNAEAMKDIHDETESFVLQLIKILPSRTFAIEYAEYAVPKIIQIQK